MPKRLFTVYEANQLVPMLEEELFQMQQLRKQFQARVAKLAQMKHIQEKSTMQVKEDIFIIESELEFIELQLNLHIQNITTTGALLKGIVNGLVDFPAVLDGEEVLLCWKQGETAITHYHDKQEGFAGRKPL